MELTVYTDGGSINNPGRAAIAYVIYQDGKLITKHGESIGVASNNVAEYSALVVAFNKIRDLYPSGQAIITKINVFSDSQLMVNQLNGLYKVKNSVIRGLLMKVRLLEQEINAPVSYVHILREKNQLADSLVKDALK